MALQSLEHKLAYQSDGFTAAATHLTLDNLAKIFADTCSRWPQVLWPLAKRSRQAILKQFSTLPRLPGIRRLDEMNAPQSPPENPQGRIVSQLLLDLKWP